MEVFVWITVSLYSTVFLIHTGKFFFPADNVQYTVSVESLENELLSDGESYVSDEARCIDECIFFYVNDSEIEMPEEDLANIIEDVVL